ncbi:hypothetical protein BDL97_16G060500 [Sphagnum fallax]|jgi:hypothetical protein|nr:hypothetical protein BDL97_16G060500 [Sphagnum fallax]
MKFGEMTFFTPTSCHMMRTEGRQGMVSIPRKTLIISYGNAPSYRYMQEQVVTQVSCVSCRLRKFVREQTYICTSRAVSKANNFGVCQGIWHAISVQDAFKCSQGAFKCIVALDFRTSR